MSLRGCDYGRTRVHISYRLPIAHTINRDRSVSKLDEMRYLVAPAERVIWETMDENDGTFRFAFG